MTERGMWGTKASGSWNLAWVVLVGGVVMAGGVARGADPKEVFEKRTYTAADGRTLLYRMMSPAKIESGKTYPLVLFLHGAGERGDDNTAPLVHGMADFAKDENRAKYPCFVIAPQCPNERKWVEVDWTLTAHTIPETPSEPMKLVIELLDTLPKENPIDLDRVYVTGLSMGGYGTWDLIARFPDRFAAAVPVCGGADEATAPKIAKLPIWAFHGVHDTAVIPERSRRMVDALRAAGGKPGYTEYPDVAHNSWVRAYSDPHMMAWLFAQKRKAK